jgi:hypothetical protein
MAIWNPELMAAYLFNSPGTCTTSSTVYSSPPFDVQAFPISGSMTCATHLSRGLRCGE